MHININPVVYEPVYGTRDTKFTDFLAPGMIALIAFAHSIGITAIAFVRERHDGTLDRVFAAGVPPRVVIAGHFLTHATIVTIQITVLLFISTVVFGIAIQGSWILAFLILVCLGFVGMSFGLVISGAANDEAGAVQIAIGLFFPALLLSGVIWPKEAVSPSQ